MVFVFKPTGLVCASLGAMAMSAVTRSHPADVLVISGGLHNIGARLVQTLSTDQALQTGLLSQISTVVVLDLAAIYDHTLSAMHELDLEVHAVQADVSSYEQVLAALQPYESRIMGFVHLAAVSQVQACCTDHERCMAVNVDGTQNVLDAMLAVSGDQRPWFVLASSREVYGGLLPAEVVSEKSMHAPVNIYGESKMLAEHAVRAFAQQTGTNAIIARFVNVYGGCQDHPSRLVPNLISSALQHKQMVLFGGKKTISLLHIDDAVQALVLATIRLSSVAYVSGTVEDFNISGGPYHDVFDIDEIAATIQTAMVALLAYDALPAPLHKERASDASAEPEHFRASISKATAILGYKPAHSFSAAYMTSFISSCFVPVQHKHKPSSARRQFKRIA